jgi:hypothetical protein
VLLVLYAIVVSVVAEKYEQLCLNADSGIFTSLCFAFSYSGANGLRCGNLYDIGFAGFDGAARHGFEGGLIQADLHGRQVIAAAA